MLPGWPGADFAAGAWMRLKTRSISASLAVGATLLVLPRSSLAQEQPPGFIDAGASLPDAPQPQFAALGSDPGTMSLPPTQESASGQDPNRQQPASAQQTPPAQDSSSSQTPAQQPASDQTQHQKADEQLKEQEKQRVLGVVPAFNTSYRFDAVSLTAGQKMSLAFRSSIDPVTFAAAFLVAGYHEALDDDTGFRWGIEGYGRRSGASYLDAFDGTIIGNGILPAVLRQDPRYFRMGHGTVTHRLLYSLATNVICKHDNTGKWEPNYSNVAGNIISGAISNLYYPPSNSGWGQTITNGLTVTAEGGVGSVFQEFWPDISRKFLHKDPTHGLDAQARAQDAAEKQAKQEAKQTQQQGPR
jgi:hypothetical protein